MENNNLYRGPGGMLAQAKSLVIATNSWMSPCPLPIPIATSQNHLNAAPLGPSGLGGDNQNGQSAQHWPGCPDVEMEDLGVGRERTWSSFLLTSNLMPLY